MAERTWSKMRIDENHLTQNFILSFEERWEYRNLNPIPDTPLLPPPSIQDANKALLVLDLDQTLINTYYTPPPHYDFMFELEMPSGRYKQVYVQIRPDCEEFLRVTSQWFELAIYTAALSMYADKIIDRIDRNHLIKHRLYRPSCGVYKEHYVKDLEFLGRPLRRILLVDNHPASYMAHFDNGIPIYSYLGQPDDTGLKDLLTFLQHVHDMEDVVPAVKRYGLWWRHKLYTYLQMCARYEKTNELEGELERIL